MESYSFNPLTYYLRVMLATECEKDKLFAQTYKTKTSAGKKSIAECAEYITGEAYAYAKEHKVGNTAMAGIPDEELIGMAKHYFDEDDIKVRPMNGASVKVSAPAPKTDAKPSAKPAPKTAKKDEKKDEKPASTKIVNFPKGNAQKALQKAEKQAAKQAKVDEQVEDGEVELTLW